MANNGNPTETATISFYTDILEALNEHCTRTDQNLSAVVRKASKFYLQMKDVLKDDSDDSWDDYKKRHNPKSC